LGVFLIWSIFTKKGDTKLGELEKLPLQKKCRKILQTRIRDCILQCNVICRSK